MNKLERKEKRQRRLDLTLSLERLETEHCKPCDKKLGGKQKPENVCGKCPIYKQIRTIGEELSGVISINYLTADKYLKMRSEGLTDIQVSERVGCNVKTLAKWKDSKNVNFVMPRKKKIKLLVTEYQAMKNKGLIDTEIAKELNVSEATLVNWKRENNITRSYKKNVEEKPMSKSKAEFDKAELQKTIDSYFETRKTNSDELKDSLLPNTPSVDIENPHTSIINHFDSIEIEKLKDQLFESQSEIHRLSSLNESLKTQNTRLREHENDYRDLEVQFKNLEYKFNSLAAENEDLKEVAVLNQLLMRQHVKFVDRQAPKEIEVNNTWR